MSVTNEIEKLAGLRNQGLITDEEYQARKKRLLRAADAGGKRRPWYKSWWLRAPLGIVGVAGLAYTLMGGMKRLPECDSAKAFDLVTLAVDKSAIGRTQGLSIIKLSGVLQPKSSNGWSRRSCFASAVLNNGQERTIHYDFTWADWRRQQIEVSVQFM